MSQIDILEKLVNYGVLGIVLVWFMLRFEGLVKANTDAINNMKDVITKLCEKLDLKE